jgi:AbrB family looped-hinge helix DNA binding protein
MRELVNRFPYKINLKKAICSHFHRLSLPRHMQLLQKYAQDAMPIPKTKRIISYTSFTFKERRRCKPMEKNGKFMSCVKIGPKGQIVIPKEVRDMFGISPGDTLLLLADSKKGIALERYGVFAKIADAIFAGKGKEIYPEETQESSEAFARAIASLQEDKHESD